MLLNDVRIYTFVASLNALPALLHRFVFPFSFLFCLLALNSDDAWCQTYINVNWSLLKANAKRETEANCGRFPSIQFPAVHGICKKRRRHVASSRKGDNSSQQFSSPALHDMHRLRQTSAATSHLPQ